MNNFAENIKYYKKQTILTGYFGEKSACNGCIIRGGSQFANILQPIYLTASRLKKKHAQITNIYVESEIVENYCYSCARNEINKLDKDLIDCWSKENNNEAEKPNPEKCVRCQMEREKVGEFRKHDGENYCLPCLIWLKG